VGGGDAVAELGQLDGWGEDLGEGHRAVAFECIRQRRKGDRSRHRHVAERRACFARTLHPRAVDADGDRREPVDRNGPPVREAEQDDGAAAESRAAGLGGAEGERRRHGGIDRVAAQLEDAGAGRGGFRRARDDHAERRAGLVGRQGGRRLPFSWSRARARRGERVPVAPPQRQENRKETSSHGVGEASTASRNER